MDGTCTRGHANPADSHYCRICGESLRHDAPPVWTTPRHALSVVAYRRHLRRTLLITVIVGTVLFTINQLDVMLAGEADLVVVAKIVLTYVVPFVVSNVGILIATHRPR